MRRATAALWPPSNVAAVLMSGSSVKLPAGAYPPTCISVIRFSTRSRISCGSGA